MHTIRTQAAIGADGHLRLDLPCNLPPGRAEVVIVLSPREAGNEVSLVQLIGLGQEIWRGIDARTYLNELRDEWLR